MVEVLACGGVARVALKGKLLAIGAEVGLGALASGSKLLYVGEMFFSRVAEGVGLRAKLSGGPPRQNGCADRQAGE